VKFFEDISSYCEVKMPPFLCTSQMFGPQRQDLTGDWRKLLKEELHDVYSSPDIWVIGR